MTQLKNGLRQGLGETMTNKELMLSGQLYIAKDEELIKDNMRARRLTRLINQTTEDELDKRQQLCRELFGSAGENIWVEAPIHADYGCNTYIGDNFYANYDCIIIDVAKVTIGDNVFLAPRVGIYTAGHPIDADVRNTQLEYGKPITIGSNVWIGGNTVINPGVTIGSNVVIGSGSVVTKDIPDNVVAVGNPCRVLRPIDDNDKKYWEQEAAKYRECINN